VSAATQERTADKAEDKALVISLSNIGDAVMTTPVLEAIHNSAPELRIDIVADQRSQEIFTHCPYRDQILLRDKRAGLSGTIALIKQLRQNRYRLVADLRTDGLAYLLRAGHRYTRWRAPAPAGPHAVQRHMAVVQAFTGATIPPCRVWLAAGERVLPDQLPRSLSLAPGANWPGKCWPAGAYVALLEHTEDLFDQIVLMGNEQDKLLTTQITQQLAGPLAGRCVDLAGRTTLLDAATVLSHSRAFVGNDSGLGHLGAAVGTPTLTVFGPGEPERYHPWGERANWLSAPEGKLAALSPERVAEHLRAHLEKVE
jgi:heptosyltransferase-3